MAYSSKLAERYAALKAGAGAECVVLVQVGSFMQMQDEDARTAVFCSHSQFILERAVARQRIVQLIHSHRFTEKPRRTLRVRLRFFANR